MELAIQQSDWKIIKKLAITAILVPTLRPIVCIIPHDRDVIGNVQGFIVYKVLSTFSEDKLSFEDNINFNDPEVVELIDQLNGKDSGEALDILSKAADGYLLLESVCKN